MGGRAFGFSDRRSRMVSANLKGVGQERLLSTCPFYSPRDQHVSNPSIAWPHIHHIPAMLCPSHDQDIAPEGNTPRRVNRHGEVDG